MKAKILVSSTLITQKEISELNNQIEECEFAILRSLGYSPISPEVVMVIIELLQNMGYNATYDLLKISISSIISKLHLNKRHETRIVVLVDGIKSEIRLNLDISEEQKDKLIDATIERFLK